MSTIAAARAARAQKKPFVLIQNNPFIEYRFPLNVVQRGADATIARYTVGSADRLLAISEFTARYVQRLAPRREVTVMHLGTDAERFSPVDRARRAEIRRRLDLPVDAFIALTVRRLFYRNGLDTLLDAATRLRDLAGLHVVIGGTGPEHAEIKDRIARDRLAHVDLVGYIPDLDLPDYYRAADVFVLPTRTAEGFGLVLMEAAASGVASIATDSGAPREVVDDGVTGLLVPPGAPEALASAIATLYGSSGAGRGRWARRARPVGVVHVGSLDRHARRRARRSRRAEVEAGHDGNGSRGGGGVGGGRGGGRRLFAADGVSTARGERFWSNEGDREAVDRTTEAGPQSPARAAVGRRSRGIERKIGGGGVRPEEPHEGDASEQQAQGDTAPGRAGGRGPLGQRFGKVGRQARLVLATKKTGSGENDHRGPSSKAQTDERGPDSGSPSVLMTPGVAQNRRARGGLEGAAVLPSAANGRPLGWPEREDQHGATCDEGRQRSSTSPGAGGGRSSCWSKSSCSSRTGFIPGREGSRRANQGTVRGALLGSADRAGGRLCASPARSPERWVVWGPARPERHLWSGAAG